MGIKVVQGDITKLAVDAIVNAANSSLLGGGGVDGAIHRAAGKKLLEECRTLHGCMTGEAKMTKGYNLPAKYVIHTVGPVYKGGGNEAQLLANAYRNSMRTAYDAGFSSVAFLAISTGVYGYPKEEAARIAIETISEFIKEFGISDKMDVILVAFSAADATRYEKLLGGTQQ